MAGKATKVWECVICSYQYDEAKEGVPFSELPDDWECPDCGAPKSEFEVVGGEEAESEESDEDDSAGEYLARWARSSDKLETGMADIHKMAATGRSITEPMRTPTRTISWDDILLKGAQLARIPLNNEEPVATRTVIGPRAAHPLVIETPVYITHMSFGALSKEVKLALARGSALVETAMCSGEGGILPESMASAHKYIFEYIPNRYSVTDENLRAVDAIEIKIGQSAKPGMGGHLPADKVTEEIAKIRGFPPGRDIISPASYEDIRNREDLEKKVAWLRQKSGGKPIGVKFAAGDVEADLQVALYAGPDFITIDGRPGATAAAPKYVKASTSVPTGRHRGGPEVCQGVNLGADHLCAAPRQALHGQDGRQGCHAHNHRRPARLVGLCQGPGARRRCDRHRHCCADRLRLPAVPHLPDRQVSCRHHHAG